MKSSAWRIIKERYASRAMIGEGARRYGGRWNSPGTAVVYVSEHQSLASLEILVHCQPIFPRDYYVAIFLEWDDQLTERVNPDSLPNNWREQPPARATMNVGDAWVCEQRTPVLAVPSAIVPVEWNYLLNPAHPDFAQIEIGDPVSFTFDRRLLNR